jgi:hypothetical protein
MVAERTLLRGKGARFQEWGCTACGWVRPYPTTATGELVKREDLEAAFHLHKCERSPIYGKVSRESLN